MRLSEDDRALLAGAEGPAGQLAMRIIVELARLAGAAELIAVTSAHIDGCLFHGQAGLDFAERLLRDGAAVRVPTTLNVASLDLLHPDRFRGDPETAAAARRLMDAYVAMGCRQTWTCAPYQLPERPGFGEHVAWAESNAIVFANSVLGARTARYGDFIDICAAITGRVPNAGLHLTERRRGQVVFDLRGLPDRLLGQDLLYPLLGHLVGAGSGRLVPVVDGLPPGVDEDRLKAVGAAAASSGEVGLVHVVGSTPEAPSLAEALQHRAAGQGGRGDGGDAARRPRPAHHRRARAGPPGRRQRRHPALLGGGVRRAGGAPGRPSRPPGGGVVRQHQPPRAGSDRGPRLAGVAGGGGGAPGGRYLHLRHLDPARDGRGGDDQLRQVGLVRAGEPRRPGRAGQPAGVCRVGRRGEGRAR